jgi:hypothetical protein
VLQAWALLRVQINAAALPWNPPNLSADRVAKGANSVAKGANSVAKGANSVAKGANSVAKTLRSVQTRPGLQEVAAMVFGM